MNFLKGFLGGLVFSVLLIIILVPLFSEGMSLTEAFASLTDYPAKLVSIAQIVFVISCVFGLVFQLISWAGRRNKERTETDRLMREYLEKKLREETEKKQE